MIEDIWKCLKRDTEEKLGFPLRGEKGADDLIYDLAKDYGAERLRAMWAYYITDDRELEFGISVASFSDPRRLARFAVRVGKGRKAAKPGDMMWNVVYSCAARCLYGDDLWHYNIVFKHGGHKAAVDALPLYHENPCPHCQGPCVMNYDWIYSADSAHADNYPVSEIDPDIAAGKDVVKAVVEATRMEPAPAAEAQVDVGELLDADYDFF